VLAAVSVFDQHRAFVEAAEPERAEVDVPLAVIDLDQADHLASKRLTHVQLTSSTRAMVGTTWSW
jgi:hypothetical protein